MRNTVLYIRVKDYGPYPQNGKYLTMENEKGRKRKYSITKCEEEDGIYRMVLERVKSPCCASGERRFSLFRARCLNQ